MPRQAQRFKPARGGLLMMMAATDSPNPQDAPNGAEIRVSAAYFAVSLTHGVTLSFFPQWLEHLGYSAAGVGFILSAQLALRTALVPFIAAFADKARERAVVAIALSLAALALSLGFWLPQTFAVSLVFALLIVPFWGGLSPVTDSIAISMQRRFRSDFARMRLWGSISFLLASVLTGMATQRFGIAIVPYLMTAMFVLVTASSMTLPRLGPVRAMAGRMALPFDGGGAGIRASLPYFSASALIIGSHGFFYAFASIHYAASGHSQTEIGLLWAFGVICEVVLFWFARRFIASRTPEFFLAVGGAAAALRWLLLPYAPLFAASPLGADFALQSLHGLSFALSYIATQRAISQRFSDEDTGKALGLSLFLNGVVFAVTTYAGGLLYERHGIIGMHAMAACALAGVALIGFNAWRDGRAAAPEDGR